MKKDTKEGIDFVFEQNPDLARIGSKEQYEKYLETIFPESKVKDIVYHASSKKFTKFNDPSSSGLSHIWFSEKPLEHQKGEYIYPVILNIKNVLNENNKDYLKELKLYESPINPEWINNYHLTGELPQYKFDGTIRQSRVDEGKSITVRDPKQIYILGSEEDKKEFSKFVHGKTNSSGTLEKIISGIFVFSFLVGLFFSFGNLTGNSIGSSGSFHRLIGIILVFVGISGFFIYWKLK